MPGADRGLGKKAESKLKLWLDKPEEGISFDRIPDQMTGFYGSSNICDFTVFKQPDLVYLESKSTWNDRFEFSLISDNQRKGLLAKSKIKGCYGIVSILFAEHQRAILLDIRDVLDSGLKSLNIKKIEQWTIPYVELETIPSRKQVKEYQGDFFKLLHQLQNLRIEHNETND